MSEGQLGVTDRSGASMRSRIVLLFGMILASVALLSVAVSSAAAKEQRAFFLAGEKSEEAAKQPKFKGEISPTYLASAGITNYEYVFQGGKKLKCPGQFSGKLTGEASELLLTSFYFFASCSFAGGGGVTITANGCETIVTASNEGPPYVGKFGVKCPAGKSYEVHGEFCSVAIPAQAGLAGMTYSNIGEGKTRAVQAAFNVSGLKYTLSGLACSAGTYENGTYTGTTTLNGYNEPF